MIELVKVSQTGNSHEGAIVVEPLPQGYGLTLGNSLRRVLLSSLAGAAITQVKIAGVKHEYSTIKGVKEDVVEILLNLKKVRLTIDGEKSVKLEIDEKGPGLITAKKIKTVSGVEIVNPDTHIASLSDPKARLNIEITAENGVGFIPIKDTKPKKMPKIEKSALVEELELSTRITNALRSADIDTVAKLLQTPKEELVKLKNMGAKSISDIEEKLKDKDLI